MNVEVCIREDKLRNYPDVRALVDHLTKEIKERIPAYGSNLASLRIVSSKYGQAFNVHAVDNHGVELFGPSIAILRITAEALALAAGTC